MPVPAVTPGLALAFFAAMVTVLAMTPLVRRAAVARGLVATPRSDRWHHRPIALLGGVAVWMGVLVGHGASGAALGVRPLFALAAGSAMFLVGLFDDIVPLKPSTKLTAQIAVGCATVAMGIVRPWTGSPVIDALLSIAWVVAIANAFNLIDNMDGLSASVAAITALALCFSLPETHYGVIGLSAALAGACLGFLVFNFHPASIFMGDSGSLFIGTTLAVLALGTAVPVETRVVATIALPALIVLIPVFDVLFVAVSRTLSARPATTGGRDHTSHRLVALGLSERQAVLLLSGLAALSGASAVALSKGWYLEGELLLLPAFIGVVMIATHLTRVPVYGQDDYALLRGRRFTPMLVELTYKRRILEVVLDFFLIVGAYYAAYLIRFDREFPEYYSLFVVSLPIVIGCHLMSFFVAGVYRSVWQYVSIGDMMTYARGIVLGLASSVVALLFAFRFEGYSRTLFIINGMVLLILMAASRLSFRLLRNLATGARPGALRALIYGAGEGGVMLLRELKANASRPYHALAFLDDDPTKHGKTVDGLYVAGGSSDLEAVADRLEIDVVILSTGKIEPSRLTAVQRQCELRHKALLRFEFRLQPLQRQTE
jgi:UDP-GlcNAc:undecaprenyl-phosphate/decaprenyl-phosphate GlcNAc-1-phosphate transferase